MENCKAFQYYRCRKCLRRRRKSLNAFWRTLQADAVVPSHDSSQAMAHGSERQSTRRVIAKDLLYFIAWWLTIPIGIDEGDRRRDEFLKSRATEKCRFRDVKKCLGDLPAVHSIIPSAQRAMSGRRMFITQKGYFGLGPQCIQPGNEVAILAGGAAPFILGRQGAATGEPEMSDMIQAGWGLLRA